MFKILKKLIFKNKKESKWFDEEYEILEELEEPADEIIYRNSSKILIVTEKNHIDDKDNTEWFRGTIKIDKVQNYLKHMDIQKGDLVEVYYKESVRNNEVIDREIQSLKKLEDILYNIKTEISKVKKVYDLGACKKGIEFENGNTYSEIRYLCIDPCPTAEEEYKIYRKTFIYEGDLCKETYLEISKDGNSICNTITIKVDKIIDDITYSNINELSINSYEDVEKLLDDAPIPDFSAFLSEE